MMKKWLALELSKPFFSIFFFVINPTVPPETLIYLTTWLRFSNPRIYIYASCPLVPHTLHRICLFFFFFSFLFLFSLLSRSLAQHVVKVQRLRNFEQHVGEKPQWDFRNRDDTSGNGSRIGCQAKCRVFEGRGRFAVASPETCGCWSH